MPSFGVVGGIGPLEIGIVLLIVLIIFGPKRIPELGRSLGSGMRGFKDAVTGKDGDPDEHERLERPREADLGEEEAAREEERAATGGPGAAGDRGS